MSRCSLQLYVNENFTFSRPSLASSDDFLKNLNSSDLKKSSLTTSHTDKDVLPKYTLPIKENCLTNRLNSDNYEYYPPLLTNYLLRHKRSIEVYRRIRRQQEEILNLCKEKLARKLSGSFLSGIKDEDIIRALKIIQDTELQLSEPRTSDEILRCILKGIVSDDSKWCSKSEQDDEKSDEDRAVKCLPGNISFTSGKILPKPRKGYSVVFRKIRAIFKKPGSFTNSFTVNSKINERLAKAHAVSCYPKNLIDPIERKLIYPYHIEGVSQNLKIYATSAYGRSTRKPYKGMGSKTTCACHRNLLKLQNEFVKQQSEIRLINKNLEQCLCILHNIGDQPKPTRLARNDANPLSKNIHVYSASGAYSGPYGDRYFDEHSIRTVGYSTPQKSRESIPRRQKGGGCGGTKQKKSETFCPAKCPYSDLRPRTDSRFTLHALTSSASNSLRLVRNRTRFCGCCRRRDSDSDSIYGEPTIVKLPKRTVQVQVSRDSSIMVLPVTTSVTPRKQKKKSAVESQSSQRCSCCGRKPKHKPGCSELCLIWSEITMREKINQSAQTLPSHEVKSTDDIKGQHRSRSNSISFFENGSSTTASSAAEESIVGSNTVSRLVPCSKHRCQQDKDEHCRCQKCKFASKSGKFAPKSRSRIKFGKRGINTDHSMEKSRSMMSAKQDKLRKKISKKRMTKSNFDPVSNASLGSALSTEPNIINTNMPGTTVVVNMCTDKVKTKRQCCLIRFCKTYICRG